jgi:hypothetical protein
MGVLRLALSAAALCVSRDATAKPRPRRLRSIKAGNGAGAYKQAVAMPPVKGASP